jgi:hypothetical protein
VINTPFLQVLVRVNDLAPLARPFLEWKRMSSYSGRSLHSRIDDGSLIRSVCYLVTIEFLHKAMINLKDEILSA